MKKLILFSILALSGIIAFAQLDPVQKTDMNAYSQLRDFLFLQRSHPGVFVTKFDTHWNSKLYQEQYQQLLEINKKKEFYPVLVFDSRFVSQSYPSRFSSQNYIWVPAQDYSLGEQIASDIISGIINTKKKPRFNSNKKGYYTPAGLKY